MMLTTESHLRLSDAYTSEILQAASWEQLRKCIQDSLTTLDVCDFMLMMNISSSSNDVPVCHTFGSLPEPVINAFCLHTQADPINRHFAKSSWPLTWLLEQLCALNAGPAYPLLKEHGISHGLSVSIHSEQAMSRVDFYSNAIDSYPYSTARQADALLIGTCIHEATESLWRKTTPNQRPLLSAREIECLEWSSLGKTSQEIGQILDITQHTVYFHLKNAAAKLQVYGLRHAVSRAILYGLIKPKKYASDPSDS